MFGIGTTELLVILVVALIVVGPKKLPQIAKTLGKAMGEFKRVSTDLHRTINTEIERDEQKNREKEETAKKKASGGKASKKSEEDKKAENAYNSAVAANTFPQEESSEQDKTNASQADATQTDAIQKGAPKDNTGTAETAATDITPHDTQGAAAADAATHSSTDSSNTAAAEDNGKHTASHAASTAGDKA